MVTRRPFLAAYDIASPVRLRQALKVLKGYAVCRQKSVFECFLTPGEQVTLLAEMEELLDPEEDRFVLIALDLSRPARTLGIGIPMADPVWFYIG